ncbi:TPA: hypothetical protein QBA39_000668 [Shigella flexneri]|nr:hypothetical protein [Shigella flexneri]
MTNKKMYFILILVFTLLQVCFFALWKARDGSTTSLECTSTLTRNAKTDHSLYYSANLSVILKKDGSGSFTIVGLTDEDTPRKFSYSYFFTYKIDSNGRISGNAKAKVSGLENQIKDENFRLNFLDASLTGKGNARLSKFNNVYIFSIPGLIINTCAPI